MHEEMDGCGDNMQIMSQISFRLLFGVSLAVVEATSVKIVAE